MSDQSHTICPLCLKPAQVFGTIDIHRHEAIRCEACGEFAISDGARKRISGLPVQFKDAWREKIKETPPEEIFLLTIGPVGSGGQIEESRVPRHKIRAMP